MNYAKHITRLWIVLLAFAAFGLAQSSSVRVSKNTVEGVDAYLDKLEKVGYSGTVLIAVDGKPVLSRGVGYSDREQKIKNSPKTLFDIGSITKQFTAAAILKLEMQGKLSTDDKISKYFPNVPADKASITIHNLLRHESGLRGGIGKDFDKISEAEFVEKVLNSELRSPVGTRFGYSNIGYSLLGLIVEKVSGQNYETYLYENLWKPAGMEVTGYRRPKFDASLITVGYKNDERWGKPTEKEWDKDAPYLHLKGNGGIISTTEDLLKWDQALLGNKILSNEAKKKYYFPALRSDEAGNSHYGYGWDVRKTNRNTTRIWHNGSNNVLYADFYRFIDEGVTIILGTNAWQPTMLPTGRIISRMIFEPNFQPTDPVADTAANRAFTNALAEITVTKGLTAATERFQKREKGINVVEDALNDKGFELFDEKKLKEAIEIFKLEVSLFPRSSKAFDSLGEALLESGDKKSSLENYKKSLELDPENENAREGLKKIQYN